MSVALCDFLLRLEVTKRIEIGCVGKKLPWFCKNYTTADEFRTTRLALWTRNIAESLRKTTARLFCCLLEQRMRLRRRVEMWQGSRLPKTDSGHAMEYGSHEGCSQVSFWLSGSGELCC